jgi:hypothetical protein
MSSPENITGLVPKLTGLQGSEVVPKSRISLDTGLWDQPEPTEPGRVRLLLGQRASEALTTTGEAAFLIVGKASHPDDPRRWVIHLVPVDIQLACQACEVASGARKPGRRIVPPAIDTDEPR